MGYSSNIKSNESLPATQFVKELLCENDSIPRFGVMETFLEHMGFKKVPLIQEEVDMLPQIIFKQLELDGSGECYKLKFGSDFTGAEMNSIKETLERMVDFCYEIFGQILSVDVDLSGCTITLYPVKFKEGV